MKETEDGWVPKTIDEVCFCRYCVLYRSGPVPCTCITCKTSIKLIKEAGIKDEVREDKEVRVEQNGRFTEASKAADVVGSNPTPDNDKREDDENKRC